MNTIKVFLCTSSGILMALFLFPSCAHTLPEPDGPSLQHRISYSAYGTRSEARHGQLFYRDTAIPDTFSLVVDHGIAYHFRTRSNMWGDDGYHPGAPVDAFGLSDERFTPAFLDQGWYPGPDMRPETPATWIYVEWKGGNAFVDPAKLHLLADTLALKPIPRISRRPLPQSIRQ
jgi:hypothetical protein